MFDSYESKVGERIRYYRTKAGMTQKALANACGISEPAIRNYELGNRTPSFDTLDDIASALCVSYYALADPDLAALAGVLHCFFRLEYAHGLKPVEIDGKAGLIIDPAYYGHENSYIQQMLNNWLSARNKYDSGEWTKEQYEDWESRFPIVLSNDVQDHNTDSGDRDLQDVRKDKKRRPRKTPKKSFESV